ncbi:hypothetical protein BaRGS_00014405, partial [Batillaria attramentaria]
SYASFYDVATDCLRLNISPRTSDIDHECPKIDTVTHERKPLAANVWIRVVTRLPCLDVEDGKHRVILSEQQTVGTYIRCNMHHSGR